MRDIYYYFQIACRRDLDTFRGVSGECCTDSEGNSAVFTLEVERETVVRLGYRCTTCCTLVGLCEHLTEILQGRGVADALQYAEEDLLARHPEIAPVHRNRASLAVNALQSAARAATMDSYV